MPDSRKNQEYSCFFSDYESIIFFSQQGWKNCTGTESPVIPEKVGCRVARGASALSRLKSCKGQQEMVHRRRSQDRKAVSFLASADVNKDEVR